MVQKPRGFRGWLSSWKIKTYFLSKKNLKFTKKFHEHKYKTRTGRKVLTHKHSLSKSIILWVLTHNEVSQARTLPHTILARPRCPCPWLRAGTPAPILCRGRAARIACGKKVGRDQQTRNALLPRRPDAQCAHAGAT